MNNLAISKQLLYTFDDWLNDERDSLERSEYVAGEVFAMAGALEPHNLIVTNVVASLHGQMKKRPCRVYANDLKVHIATANAGCYPDVLVLCDKPQFYDDRHDVVLNPTLIVEVLSKSTEAYDRGDKFAMYRSLPSLRAYLLIAQQRIHVELYTHDGQGHWILSDHDRLNSTIEIKALDCVLNLAEVYDKVDF